jgi:hypothetical protein
MRKPRLPWPCSESTTPRGQIGEQRAQCMRRLEHRSPARHGVRQFRGRPADVGVHAGRQRARFMPWRALLASACSAEVYPKGFARDAAHRPHITQIQRFVRTADLDEVYAAAGKVLAGANVNAMKLEAFKYYYAPAGAAGVAGICAKPTADTIKLQADVIAAVKPFTVKPAPSGRSPRRTAIPPPTRPSFSTYRRSCRR